MKILFAPFVLALTACSAANSGTPGSPAVGHPDVPGTIVTIVFENHSASQVLTTGSFFDEFAQQNAQAAAYVVDSHPSTPNYILLTSGSTNGVTSDNEPAGNVQIPGFDNLPDQLTGAGIRWRAYMESMGAPCGLVDRAESVNGEYVVHHDPFVYYETMATNPARCSDEVVDFDAHFYADLASGLYRYMWITPNDCHDMHDCAAPVADAWLRGVVPKIQASHAYKNGGAIFVVFDEGSTRFLGASADVVAIWASPKLASTHFVSQTAFNHPSYVATVEDILGLPRLPATVDATPMDSFFVSKK